MSTVDEILARHGLAGPAELLPAQGKGSVAWATATHVVKIARGAQRDALHTEALVAPLARAAGVRTPGLVAWAHGDDIAYTVWERVHGPALDDGDAAAWRAVGREVAALHQIARADDPRGLLRKVDKRDARPWLHGLPAERAAFYGRWLDRLALAPPAPERLLHYDLHGANVLRGRDGATLIDWGDAAWGDPAADFGAMPPARVADALAGYEEVGGLGPGGPPRILRALVGQAVRLAVARGVGAQLEELEAWLRAGLPAPFSDWAP